MVRFIVLIILAVFVAACSASGTADSQSVVSPTSRALPSLTQIATATLAPSPTVTPTPRPTPTATASATATLSLTPTLIPPTLTATATPSATPTSTSLPGDLWIGPSDLRVHPDGEAYYSGDLISFQVFAHHGYDWKSSSPPDVGVQLWLGAPGEGELIGEDRVAFHGQRDGEAWVEWAWDTTGVAGYQTLTLVLDPDDEIQIGDEDPSNNLVTRVVELRPSDELPAVWADARWIQEKSACCVFHYISGSAAERDIEMLMTLADKAIAFAGERLGEDTDQVDLNVYLIDRVLGHGGFAGNAVIISYLDRFYPGGQLVQVFRHEGVHVLDRRFAEHRPALLAEGLAVYVSGGHFRPEPTTERAAALLVLERYIPLGDLADDFYPSQHEIGYLQAAGFVSYLIDRFGWEDFKAFYSAMQNNDGGQAAMIDAALQEHFGLTLAKAEAEWLVTLQKLPTSVAQVTDLRLTIEFYDTVRHYQQAWDPSAYFRRVWLPEIEEAERKGITADWNRHPSGLINVTLETMFIAADRALDEAAYTRAEGLLNAIKGVLATDGDLTASPLAEQYRALVQATATVGYEAQRIDLDMKRNQARVLATKDHGADTVELTFTRSAGVWRVTSWGN